jgi:transcriptional regulator with XRE-family HTH domain
MNGLKRILRRLELTQTELARLLEVSPRTVSLWATGEINLPGPVKAYLRMLQAAEASVRSDELGRLSVPRPHISEGLYSIRYQTRPDGQDAGHRGDAMAIIKAGNVLGADGWGGKFHGTYRFDSARRTYHFKIGLHLPPTGELVTGGSSDDIGQMIEVEAELDPPDPLASGVAHVLGRPLDLKVAYLGPLRGQLHSTRSKGPR